MSNLQNQNALRRDRFQKQNATQHDSILLNSSQLPQLRLNWIIVTKGHPKGFSGCCNRRFPRADPQTSRKVHLSVFLDIVEIFLHVANLSIYLIIPRYILIPVSKLQGIIANH